MSTPAPEIDVQLPEATTEFATRSAGRKFRDDLPHLRLVAPLRPERASRGFFAVIVAGMLALGLVIMLVINTSVAQTAFTVTELRSQQRELARTEAALTEALATAAAPPVLEAKARALGMVPSGRPVFVTIPEGSIRGKAKPAPGDRARTVNVATSLTATLLDPVASLTADIPPTDEVVEGERRQIGDGAVLLDPSASADFDEATEQAKRNEAREETRGNASDGAVLVSEPSRGDGASIDNGGQ